MISIDTLTLGNEFKDADGSIWKVTSNFSQNESKILVELEKKVVEFDLPLSEV
jgi:hypothetical protein